MGHCIVLFSSIVIGLLNQLDSSLFNKDVSELKVVCITTAANPIAEKEKLWLDREIEALEEFGFNLTFMDLEGMNSSEVAEGLSDTDVICVTGGHSFSLLYHMQQTNFADALKERLNAGALYIGGSAGAVVACPDIDYIRLMDDPEEVGLSDMSDLKGLGLLDFYIVPHVGHPFFKDSALAILDKVSDSKPSTIGLKDDQALLARGSSLEILSL